MSFVNAFSVSSMSKIVTTMLNPAFAKKALIPCLTGGALAGIGAYKLLEGANVNQGRTLLTGYIASGVALSLDGVLPDLGSMDEAGSIIIGGSAAGFIVNAAFGALLPADTNSDGTVTDAEKLANYDVHFSAISNTQRLYASIVSGIGVAIAGYAQMSRSYNNVQ